ncbi:hypothetical protein OG194_04385 [Streptomyces sp. NBC_01288]|uniref:hypothetical protein n=1 Tax=Streptomyces sp. NBC_01288 TaxID=2903814 RepID=UPI002E0D594B|nr:hypothetical protein OG194_04385 [Streptomyces sp. NBC_01288]
MAHEIHITRREDCDGCGGEHGPQITAGEWAAVVAADAELSMTPAPLGCTGPAQWSALLNTHPDESRLGTALHWSARGIGGKNPSDFLIAKMREVARALGARVRGDDGEFYDGDAEVGESGNPVSSGRRP